MFAVFGKSRPEVSTHSRPKAAGIFINDVSKHIKVSTHSRPKAAGAIIIDLMYEQKVSTHSRPKAAGQSLFLRLYKNQFQHTAARRRLAARSSRTTAVAAFQHTAARRRLVIADDIYIGEDDVSTHSRPKAAGSAEKMRRLRNLCFNTQPPEGGWDGKRLHGR